MSLAWETRTMTTSWFRQYLERRRSRRNRTKEALDERFGDLAISAPMVGGWNEVPKHINDCESQDSPPNPSSDGQRAIKKSRSSKKLIPTSFPWTERKQPPISERTESPSIFDGASDSSTMSTSEKPTVVYKPASEDFLRQMSEIGRPRTSPTPSMESNSRLQPVSLDATLEPRSPVEFPHHPSYHTGPLLQSPITPRAPSRNRTRTPVNIPNQRSETPLHIASPIPSIQKPVHADQLTISSSGSSCYTTDWEKSSKIRIEPLSRENTTNKMQRKKEKTQKQSITQELVPSTSELFG